MNHSSDMAMYGNESPVGYWNKLKKAMLSPALFSMWGWSKGHRFEILLVTLGRTLEAILALVFTLATKEIVDNAVSGNRSGMVRMAFALLAIIALQLLLTFIMRVGLIRLRSGMLRDFRRTIIEKTAGKQYSPLADIHSGELTGRILSDTATVTDGILDMIPTLVSLATQFIGAAIILLRLNKSFLFGLVGAGLLGSGMMFIFGRRLKKYHKEVREKEDKVQAALQETLQNLRITKASGIEEKRTAYIKTQQDAYVDAQQRRGKFYATAGMGINLVFRLSWLYAMIWGCGSILSGTMTYGTLTAMLQLVAQVQNPISGLTSLLSQAYGAVSSAERLDELLDKPDDIGDGMQISGEFQNLSVKHLSFSYPRQPVLTDVSFEISSGEIIALTGDSGCGKSTLFSLILGLFTQEAGTITFTTTTGSFSAGKSTRKLTSYVPQGNALFSGTLRDNIAMFRENATDAEVWQAAHLACLDDFIRSLEDGMDTVIGEKGLGLSEGQAQRIAVARALLSSAPLLLLDEATSALDEKTEKMLLQNIASLPGRTCLIVTHRKAALEICSRRVHISQGSLSPIDQKV